MKKYELEAVNPTFVEDRNLCFLAGTRPFKIIFKTDSDEVTLLPANDASLNEEVGFPGDNFINILRTNFSYEHRFGSFFYVHVTEKSC